MESINVGAHSVRGSLSEELEGPEGDSIGAIEGWLENEIQDLKVGKEADKKRGPKR